VTAGRPARGRLPAARRDRRPMLAALAVLLMLSGALGSALIAFRSGDRVSVLAARQDIPFGHVITDADLIEVRAAADTPGLINASFRDNFVGSHALSAIPQGALVHAKMFSESVAVPANGELVGVVLDPDRRPSQTLQPGQVVRLYYVIGASSQGRDGAAYSPGDPVVEAARVVDTGVGNGTDSTSITVLVKADVAGVVANYGSSGNLAVAVLPDQTRPPLDMVSE
jgi:SAF domain